MCYNRVSHSHSRPDKLTVGGNHGYTLLDVAVLPEGGRYALSKSFCVDFPHGRNNGNDASIVWTELEIV
ncbi:hypothetical protein CEXT_240431 [Caerostris extrusa]|uniref:Uncharacterized protein n=1 Tax=Caerostris extrusa TaxID=172846 RepID=A0AAV4XN08_CAEEX|nr:hypothetical protein CEXT_240431 [Caerostris extrusa]